MYKYKIKTTNTSSYEKHNLHKHKSWNKKKMFDIRMD